MVCRRIVLQAVLQGSGGLRASSLTVEACQEGTGALATRMGEGEGGFAPDHTAPPAPLAPATGAGLASTGRARGLCCAHMLMPGPPGEAPGWAVPGKGLAWGMWAPGGMAAGSSLWTSLKRCTDQEPYRKSGPRLTIMCVS